MRKLLQKILSPLLQKGSTLYLSKPRKYRYKNISVRVEPGVFPPFITISTKLLLQFTETLPLQNKTFLELGCGCGIISILAAQKGAQVTASDINETALKALQHNSAVQGVSLAIVYSDLFGKLAGQSFDYIVINPPYYPKAPKNTAEKAWFCGENFDYFEQLFVQLPQYLTATNKTYMILSEDCNLNRIGSIARHNAIRMTCIQTTRVFGERNHIFDLEKN